jgi:uncharacterized protein
MLTKEILISAPILFFVLGFVARIAKSDLAIPEILAKFFSLYILCAIGLKGGINIAQTGITESAFIAILVAIAGSSFIAFAAYGVFKVVIDRENAAAIASCYGSVSAVTFVTGIAVLERLSIPYGPYMIACMALMESPAILVAIFLYNKNSKSLGSTLRHGLTNQSVILLLGSLCIGLVLPVNSWQSIEPFYHTIFNGMLTLFLLEMGLLAASQLRDLKHVSKKIFILGLAFPIASAFACLGIAHLFNLPSGDTFLLMLLFGSASYIAAPAAMRTVIPKAKPSIYLTLSIGITFPFNIVLGIPFYLWVLSKLGHI